MSSAGSVGAGSEARPPEPSRSCGTRLACRIRRGSPSTVPGYEVGPADREGTADGVAAAGADADAADSVGGRKPEACRGSAGRRVSAAECQGPVVGRPAAAPVREGSGSVVVGCARPVSSTRRPRSVISVGGLRRGSGTGPPGRMARTSAVDSATWSAAC